MRDLRELGNGKTILPSSGLAIQLEMLWVVSIVTGAEIPMRFRMSLIMQIIRTQPALLSPDGQLVPAIWANPRNGMI